MIVAAEVMATAIAGLTGQAAGDANSNTFFGLSGGAEVPVMKNVALTGGAALQYAKYDKSIFLGRHISYPFALEAALKLKEISYIHAEGYPAAEMKHGPIALIDENMPVVFIATNMSAYEKIVSNIQEVKARGARVIVIARCVRCVYTSCCRNAVVRSARIIVVTWCYRSKDTTRCRNTVVSRARVIVCARRIRSEHAQPVHTGITGAGIRIIANNSGECTRNCDEAQELDRFSPRPGP